MQGIVTCFDEAFNQKIEVIWRDLENQFGLENAVLPKIPHFSYHVATDYDIPAIKQAMEVIGNSMQAFSIQTSGIGIFTGMYPVVYLPIAMTTELARLHEQIWKGVNSHSQNSQIYYVPQQWMPHITLVQGKFDSQVLGRMIELLNRDSYQWTIHVDNLSLLYQAETDQPHQIYHQVALSDS